MKLSVIGTGYVGLVSGSCFAEMGNTVHCIDTNSEKISALKRGEVPFFEPGLAELVARNVAARRLHFAEDYTAIAESDIVFIAVGTPPGEDGSADCSHVLEAARCIVPHLNGYTLIVNKSTVPPGTARAVKKTVGAALAASKKKARFDVVSNPEFLKEGAAIEDFMYPDRVVIGCKGKRAKKLMSRLYEPFARNQHPILVMDTSSAELCKYAANAMLALRISFMNEMAALCERTGGDITQVRAGIGSDSRIGLPFLYAGTGYGGSCFPKDIKALIASGEREGLSMRIVKAVEEVNEAQKLRLVAMATSYFGPDLRGKTFAIWGLAFKPRTDDMREAPSLVIVRALRSRGARLRVYDPEALANAKKLLADLDGIEYFEDQYSVLEGCDALLLVTEWQEFRQPDFERMKSLLKAAVIFDGRNQYKSERMKKKGFCYRSIGR